MESRNLRTVWTECIEKQGNNVENKIMFNYFNFYNKLQ
jgi:hypothetical protein